MSTHITPVVRIDNLRPNRNSDSLDIWNGPQGPCQVKRGSFKVGDLAVFVPAESLVDVARPEFKHLEKLADGPAGRFPGKYRIRGVKLRGELSVGLIVALPVELSRLPVGSDVSEVFGIEKWNPPATHADYPRVLAGTLVPLKVRNVPAYDVENAWRFARLAETDTKERAWAMTEKIHGMNFRMCLGEDGKIIVGSRTRWLRPDCAGKPGEWWHQVLALYEARLMDLFQIASTFGYGYDKHALTFYGEVFGPTQDLKYGHPTEPKLRLFDIHDGNRFIDFEMFVHMVRPELRVPTLQFDARLLLTDVIARARHNASGLSTLANHMREGIVVRPFTEEMVTLTDTAPDGTVRTKQQRLQFKVVSAEYLSRKGGSEVQE